MTSLLYVAFTIPAVLLSPLAGVYVDRWSNKTILIISNVARGIFVSLLLLPAVSHSPKLCLLLAFLISIASQFFGPAETASIPRLSAKRKFIARQFIVFYHHDDCPRFWLCDWRTNYFKPGLMARH